MSIRKSDAAFHLRSQSPFATHFVMSQKRIRICRTDGLPQPTYYVQALQTEFAPWAFCEKRSVLNKGQWATQVFADSSSAPIDLEIGTGNGIHFAHYAEQNPKRNLIGIEWKFKPLIQSIRRALNHGAKNARIVRYDAGFPDHLFAAGELDRVMIHFPDPWPKEKQKKHRLINDAFLTTLFKLQKKGAELEFKTDNRDYFDWAMECFERSAYQQTSITYDLHNSDYQSENFVTHFEKIFLKQGLPIHRATFQVPG